MLYAMLYALYALCYTLLSYTMLCYAMLHHVWYVSEQIDDGSFISSTGPLHHYTLQVYLSGIIDVPCQVQTHHGGNVWHHAVMCMYACMYACMNDIMLRCVRMFDDIMLRYVCMLDDIML